MPARETKAGVLIGEAVAVNRYLAAALVGAGARLLLATEDLTAATRLAAKLGHNRIDAVLPRPGREGVERAAAGCIRRYGRLDFAILETGEGVPSVADIAGALPAGTPIILLVPPGLAPPPPDARVRVITWSADDPPDAVVAAVLAAPGDGEATGP